MVDVIVETKLHVVKEHIRRRVVYRKTGRCRACGERTTPDLTMGTWRPFETTMP